MAWVREPHSDTASPSARRRFVDLTGGSGGIVWQLAEAAQVEALCLAQGVPAALLPTFLDADFEHLGVSGGNPDLEPETGDTLVPPPGLPEEHQVGLVGLYLGASNPEWKWLVNLRYEWQALTLGAGWRYLDLFAAYAFDDGALAGLTLRAGVEHLADETPPLVPSAIQANTDASQYDVLGRRYFLNLSYRL